MKKIPLTIQAVWLLLTLAFAIKAESWGTATNDLQLGATIFPFWHTNQQYDLLCRVDIRNVSTNKRSIYVCRAPAEIRHEIKLLDPQGKPVEIISCKLLSLESNFQHGGTIATNEAAAQVTSFFIVDLFKVQTNGLHTLIVSERFTTNQVVPKSDYYFPFNLFYKQLPPSAYFLMPPATNTFMVSTNDLKNDNRTGHANQGTTNADERG